LDNEEPIGGGVRVDPRASSFTVHPIERPLHVRASCRSMLLGIGECRLPHPAHLGFYILLGQQPRAGRELQREFSLPFAPLMNIGGNASTV
jgi:hypothetical protein